jgi:hypothetical protein
VLSEKPGIGCWAAVSGTATIAKPHITNNPAIKDSGFFMITPSNNLAQTDN